MRLLQKMMIAALSLLASVASVYSGHASAQNTNPCEAKEQRAFDFWLGEWDVFTPDGKQAGTNSISKEYNGCVLHERYKTPRSFAGESLNAYDSVRKKWHQTWVDNSGTILLLDGGLEGNSMVLSGQGVDGDGKAVTHRITWTPNADGSVRQHWQTRLLKGKQEWQTAFDGKYVRRK